MHSRLCKGRRAIFHLLPRNTVALLRTASVHGVAALPLAVRRPMYAASQPGKEEQMRYLHTMVRVTDVDKSLDFYCNKLGLEEVRRIENEQGRFTLIFLAAPEDEATGIADNGAAGSNSPTIGTRKTIRAAAISATSPTRSTISTRPASG